MLFGAFVINVEISTNRLTPYLSKDRDSSYYHLVDVVIEDTISLELYLTYKAHPTKILDQQDRVTCNKTTQFYMVQRNDHSKDEATWEREEFLWSNYPDLLPST
jgi:hypothetical protein